MTGSTTDHQYLANPNLSQGNNNRFCNINFQYALWKAKG